VYVVDLFSYFRGPFFLHAASGPYFLVDVISVDVFFQLWTFFPWTYFSWTFFRIRIRYTRFPVTLPLQPCLYLAPFSIYYHLFSKYLQRSRDHEHSTFGGNLSFMHQFTSVSISTRLLLQPFRIYDCGLHGADLPCYGIFNDHL